MTNPEDAGRETARQYESVLRQLACELPEAQGYRGGLIRVSV